ncbi:hypothetical protein BDA96_06G238700 [Sorghum bicolor]|uniref:Uncharacterized protein n=1 Tax=Sorghum bicolor TaxID=4558 RepID=A0A921QST4_SORBI|nr:uncharacterized protein LOC8074717 isoform X2 [Sorghum bicolor]KAG0527504.1 hypothetical protein BDA96_06G238700 [Sorghum bicolor]|eukprot:XP_002448545.1 uncharacterized protein LOC8074717 isoform X2 [Sorghum bicolor]
MAGRRNRSRRRRRRLRANLGSGHSESSSGSSSYDRAAHCKTSLPNRQQQVTKETKSDLRRTTRDARAVRPFLLGLIRGYYIDAISRLPAAELRTTLARGLLLGGHCYGPLHPVHNIILNSVWYAAAFPFRADPIDVDFVSTEGISRLSHRSLDGLVAYLCHQCPDLSHDDALWHLALSLAALHGASASARGAVPIGRTGLEAVPFQVAAQAARHPTPSALTSFVTSVLPPVERDVLSLLAAGRRRLSSHDILRLSAMLQPLPLPDALPQQPCSRELTIRIGRIIAERRRCCRIAYQMFIDIADAALRKFARQTGARYRLHIIYGQSIVEAGDCCGMDQYFHINFMAWPKGKQTQSQIPVCFFAEAHNPATRNCSEEAITSCCMLGCAQPSNHVDNCYACARIKRKIDHPNGEEHFGGHPHKTDETEDDRDCPTTIDVDYRFFDPDRDIDLVKWYADKIDRAEAIYSKLGLKNGNTNDEDIAEEDIEVYCRRYA